MSSRAVLAGVSMGSIFPGVFGIEHDDIRPVSAQEKPSILHPKEPGRKGCHFSDGILQRQDLLFPDVPAEHSGLTTKRAGMTDSGCVGLLNDRPRPSVTGEHQPILLHR